MAVALKILERRTERERPTRLTAVDMILLPQTARQSLESLESPESEYLGNPRHDFAHGWTSRRRRSDALQEARGDGRGGAIRSDELQALLLAATESADGLAWLTAYATTHTLLSSEEERALAMRLRARQRTPEEAQAAQAARERMILANLRLVMRVAAGLQRVSGDVELIDLIEEGIIGLMRAVDRFDPEKGWRFSTYATWWIAQAMQRAAAQSGHAIRLPVYLYERRKRMLRARAMLLEELGREPRLDELVARCRERGERSLDETQAALLLACHADVVSLNAPTKWAARDGSPGEEEVTLAGLTADPHSVEWFDLAEQREDARWLLEIAAYALGVRGDLRDLQARTAQTREAQARMERLRRQQEAAQEAHTRHLADEPTPATAQRHAAHARLLQREQQRLGRELRKTQLEIAGIRSFDIWASRALASETVSLDVIGRRYGITRERVRQIELEANKRVRKALAEVGVTSAASYRGAR